MHDLNCDLVVILFDVYSYLYACISNFNNSKAINIKRAEYRVIHDTISDYFQKFFIGDPYISLLLQTP